MVSVDISELEVGEYQTKIIISSEYEEAEVSVILDIEEDTTPPIANAGEDKTVEINESLTFDGSASTDNVGIVSYKWDIDSSNGLDWEDPDLTIENPTLESGYSTPGIYIVTLQVSDFAGNLATDTLTIAVNPPPKILISEIQISPIEERFIELYNPNDQDVDLTGWYIQRKTETGTSWDSLISSTKFEGKSIQPQSHFLIGRTSTFSPEILLEDLTLTENNVISLKNPNREIVDKVGWGTAQDYEGAPTLNPQSGKSIGRKWIEGTGYQDTDNNSVDFEIQTPTPKAKNQSQPTPPQEIYRPAIGYNDPEEKWTDEVWAYDEDTSTGAKATETWVDTYWWLEFFAPSQKSHGIRLWIHRGSGNSTPQGGIIELYYNQEWHILVRIPTSWDIWQEISYPEENVEKARFKFLEWGVGATASMFLNEFQFKIYE